ncbi:MAG: aminomethyl transferase family protein, partial [Rhodobacteraceae bacterium]|nr:aminomethyl transferase family protein [Paracoccaceae bacterium]
PKSRELLSRITRDDVSAEGMKFRDCRETFVGGVPVVLNRISFSGELGYEIYCRPQYLLRLSEAIEEAGADLGYKWYGARALMSLRLEKGWGAWGLEFRPDFDAVESGMDAFINWNKEFTGKSATLAAKEAGPKRKLVTLVIDTPIDVTSDEAVLVGDMAVGYITSGGYAHHANPQTRARWPAFFYGVDFVLIYMFNFSQMIKSRGGVKHEKTRGFTLSPLVCTR